MSIIAGAVLALSLPTVQERDLNKIVCKSEQNTGSRLQRRRICRTRAEWAEMDREKNRRNDSDGSPFRDEGVQSLPRRPGS